MRRPIGRCAWRRAGSVMAVVAAMTGTTVSSAAASATRGAAAASAAPAAPAAPAVDFGQELEAFLRVPAVVGREKPASEFLAGRLAGLPARTDRLGNLVVRFGAGEPRRLVVCPLGEPGFVVSRVEPDGYLRLAPAGEALGALWEQAHAGQVVLIAGAHGPIAGAVAIPSIHLQSRSSGAPPAPFSIEGAYVDVGAESAKEVEELGVRLLDPVALIRRPVRLAHDSIAAPAARVKAGCLAAVEAARQLQQAFPAGLPRAAGTVVFAWTTLDLVNGAGLEYLLREEGPFAAAIDLGWGFGWEVKDDRSRPAALPRPGTGLISDGPLPEGFGSARDRKPQPAAFLAPGSRSGGRWGTTRVAHLGLPALYPETPVETVALQDAAQLTSLLVASLGLESAPAGSASVPRLRPPLLAAAPPDGSSSAHDRTAALLSSLISRYGVSGDEAQVRAEVVRQLPAWAKPVTDEAGNLIVTTGTPVVGSTPVLFLAHLDEVGFRVQEVLPDGRLKVERRGGVYRSLWEAQAALVHGERGIVPGVFEPRPDWLTAARAPLDELTVSVGAASAEEARALGVRAGSSVTMPKQLFRLGRNRVVGRSMDDRVGSSALLLALRQLAPNRLARQVTFAWTVGEEVGLEGSTALARRLEARGLPAASGAAAAPLRPGARLRVHPVDTFVSADSPLESRRFAYAELGRGPVLRAMDGASYAPRELVDRALRIAGERGIPLQLGLTGGATDGIPFISLGADVLPISWPGRYSHSPVEVADFRDIENLVSLILALAAAAD
jgi:putative aminopeptidase FrvX